MHDHVTLLRPDAQRADSKRIPASLAPDLAVQLRGRVQVLALLIALGFGIGPVIFLTLMVASLVLGTEPPSNIGASSVFLWIQPAAVGISLALWWRARNPQVHATELLRLGLLYQVAICFIIGVSSYWSQYAESGTVPPLTWIPAVVILFPLIMPGPPRLMLWGAIAAGAMGPLSLALVQAAGLVAATAGDYQSAALNSGVAVVFAYLGARTLYGLQRQVLKARQMGSYHLEERLGGGGMGEVWSARHRMLARPAAIKVIQPEILAAQGAGPRVALQRFEREAQATARLRSPHTVELYDFGVAADGTFYYVMELLDGLDATTLVDRFGPLPADRVVFLLRQVCHSLSEAHASGLVHRDIKPANIPVCRYGEEYDFVKVPDFGLVQARAELAVDLTADHFVGGTPTFIAPEQALGKATVDGRADLYALGCVAYWLLSGQFVFTGDTAMEVLTKHVNAPPPPVSRRTELPISAQLERLVMACLEKEPDLRPASARVLLDQLDAVVTDGRWTQERARAWWQLHVPAVAAAVGND
jgi:serine/threonine-protein kinase